MESPDVEVKANTRSAEQLRGSVPDAVRQQLAKILASEVFARSDRMKRFLRFTVERTLEGQQQTLKEYSIAVAVFDKPESFDPRLDPIVRVEAGRLRSKLREYYASDGREDSILISFRKRSYVPVFERKSVELPGQPSGAIAAHGNSVNNAAESSVPSPAAPGTLAVLPFADLSPRKNQEYFCDGITEELVNALSRVEALQLASRTSSMQFRGVGRDIRQIGRQLNVSAVLEGSVRMFRKRVRIAIRLINVADGYELWSEIYDRELEDIFGVQEEISQSVAKALRSRFSELPGDSLVNTRTASARAYQLYLRGRYYMQKTNRQSLRRAIKCFQQGILADPEYSLAYAGLADCYVWLTWFGTLVPGRGWRKVLENAQMASAIDERLSQASAALGAVRAVYEWDWAGSEEQFSLAIQLDPRYPTAHHWYAVFCLAPQGRLEEAVVEIKKAEELDPLSSVICMHSGQILYFSRQYDAAIERYQKTLSLDPFLSLAHCHLGIAYRQQNRSNDALRAFERARELSADEPLTLGAMGHCYGLNGGRHKARRMFSELEKLAKRRYVSPLDLARIQLGLGEIESAVASVERACDTRCSRAIHLRVDPLFDALKSSAPFVRLFEKMALGPSQEPAVRAL